MSDFSNQPAQGYAPPGMGYMPPQDPYALRVGFGKRLGAFIIDFIIILILGGIVGYVMQDTFAGMVPAQEMGGMDESVTGMMQTWVAISLGMYFFTLLYSFVEMLTGASPAKHILGIIAAHEDRRAGDTGLYVKRWFIKSIPSIVSLLSTLTAIGALSILSSVLSLAFLVGCFFALGEKKQALHDMLAKTAIYHKADVIPVDAPAVQTA